MRAWQRDVDLRLRSWAALGRLHERVRAAGAVLTDRRDRVADAARRHARRVVAWIRRPSVLGAGSAAAVMAGTILAPGLAARVWDHPYFAVSEIVVSPTAHVRAGVLLGSAGLRPGVSLWRVDPAALATHLEAHPWVRRASVRREFPRRLVVRVVERTPAAILMLDRLYHLDQSGVAFAPLGDREPLTLPLVTGVEAAILAGEGPYARHAIRRAVKLLELMGAAGLPFRVSEVHIDRGQGITVFPVAPALALKFGWSQFPEKLVRLGEVLEAFAGRDGQIQEIDLTLRSQAVIRLRKSGGRERQARV